MPRRYHLFISHSWTYDDHYNRLVRLLDQDPVFPYRNYSVPRHDPLHTNGTDRELEAAIREQVRLSSCVVICAGVYASYSKWIDKEIRIASREFGKPIIGVKPWENINMSRVVTDSADRVVSWRKAAIEKAIIELVGE